VEARFFSGKSAKLRAAYAPTLLNPATSYWAYYTVKALYQLGRVEDARRIFRPMLSGYAAGKFQGFDPKSGRSLDWRDWQGGGHGYEGLLVDNYHALLAVLEDVKAKKR